MSSKPAKRLAALFKALGDPTRLRLVSGLVDQPRCVHELVEAMQMSQPAVSQQLRVLRDLGIVRGRKEGRHVYYQLDDDHVRALYTTGLAHIEHAGPSDPEGPS